MEEGFNVKKQVKILLTLFLFIFILGTLGFMLTEKTNIQDSFVLTAETLALIHTKDLYGGSKILEIFLLIFGVTFIWFALWTTMNLALEGQFSKYFFEVKNMDKIKKLKNHYIICGAGRVGENIAKILKSKYKDFVLLEKNQEVAKAMNNKGYLTLNGASVEEDTLVKAGIKNAKYLVACTGDDAKNILIILTARELNPSLTIASRANEESMVNKLKTAGAKHIFLPELLGAREIIDELKK
jgi:voltage-gated potassium channel